mmetsp:Transcript_30807/g.47202  ORF Transcript_30807/g.47202 Transcript_30807/m.47202 type:complete len:268 (+) Transcript_30807:103-906(+)
MNHQQEQQEQQQQQQQRRNNNNNSSRKFLSLVAILSSSAVVQVRSFQPPLHHGLTSRLVGKDSTCKSWGVFESTSVEDDTITKSTTLPPVIQHIANEVSEFELNLGKAMDTIRKDYPNLLKESPDYSIYSKDIVVEDPSGVRLTGLSNYKRSFAFAQTMIKVLFVPEASGLQFRMVYDFARSAIRVSWHVELVPKYNLGRPIYVDGISLYTLDRASGLVARHKVDHLIVNSRAVMPPYSVIADIFSLEKVYGQQPQRIPVGLGVPTF